MLAAKIVRGAGWSVSSRLGGRLVDLATIVVLARALTPADFGLVALATSLIAVVDTVLEVPLIQALTRLPQIEPSHIDTAFTLGMMRAALVLLIVLAAAWPFSIVFGDPRLFLLVAVLAIGPACRGLFSPNMVTFVRGMSFRQGFIAETSGKVIAAASAAGLAYLGGGYWAIAIGSIASPLVTLIITYVLAPYRPRFSLKNVTDFLSLLGWFTTSQVFAAVGWQSDRVFLGYLIPKADLGQYTMASDVSVMTTQSLIGPAMSPVIAAFASMQNDKVRLVSAFRKASRLTMLLAMPACIGMALTGDMIFGLLLGPQWIHASDYLRWLAIAILFTAYFQPLSALALAINRVDVTFRLTLIDLLAKLALIGIGYYLFSVTGVAAARVVASIVLFIASMIWARRLTGLLLAPELLYLLKVLTACVVMSAAVIAVHYSVPFDDPKGLIKLVACIGVGGAVYGAAAALMGLQRVGV